MKKKIIGGTIVAFVVALAAFNLNFNANEENGQATISLANVEALAQDENGGGDYRWHGNTCNDGTPYECCTTNGNGNRCSSAGSCTRTCS